MTIIRAIHDKEHPYVMVARGVAQSTAISYEALGLLTYLLSKPDDWKIVPEDLPREACGKNRVYKLLKELKDAGYVVQERGEAVHDKPPVWGERIVVEQPGTEMRDTAPNPTLRDTAPNPSTPYHGSPYMANAISHDEGRLLNTDTDTKYRKEQNTHDKRARERKDFEDVPKDDRLQIIRAWADNLSIQPVNVYNRDAYHSAAADIFRAGYRAHQVGLFVKAKMSDDFWHGKTLSLAKVGELMPLWLQTTYSNTNGKHDARAAPAANGKPMPASTSEGFIGMKARLAAEAKQAKQEVK